MSSYPPNPAPGIPTKITLTPPASTIATGDTVQLSPILIDACGNVLTPAQPFSFTSSNPALVSVNSDGLCTPASGDPTGLQTGGTVEISVSYPWAESTTGQTITASAFVAVTVPLATSRSLFLTDELRNSGCWRRTPKVYPVGV